MAFLFQIRPVGEIEQGFELSCEGIFPKAVPHGRLIEAIIHAVQIGHHLAGEIQVFDTEGDVADTLPLCWETPAAPQLAPNGQPALSAINRSFAAAIAA